MEKLKCEKCGYQWYPKKNVIKYCPRCRCYEFWKPKRRHKREIEALQVDELRYLVCKHCNYRWVPKVDNPLRCPMCKMLLNKESRRSRRQTTPAVEQTVSLE